RVPASDPILQVRRQYSHVDGFDDVLAEFLKALVLLDLALQRSVQRRVLDRDADVPGQREQQFQVDRPKIIARDGAAEADEGDGPAADLTGHVIGEVQVSDSLAHGGRPGARYGIELMTGPLEENVRFGPLLAEEAEVELVVGGDAEPRVRAHGLFQAES